MVAAVTEARPAAIPVRVYCGVAIGAGDDERDLLDPRERLVRVSESDRGLVGWVVEEVATAAAASAAQYWSYLGFQIQELPTWDAPWAAARR